MGALIELTEYPVATAPGTDFSNRKSFPFRLKCFALKSHSRMENETAAHNGQFNDGGQ